MAIPVIADADTLFGATTRGFLINLDYQGLIHLHWSPLILEEMSRALVDTGRKPDDAAAKANEALMCQALPAATVGIAVQRPDPFLLALFQRQPDEVGSAFQAFRQSLRSNPAVPRLLDMLAGDGHAQVAATMLAAWQRGDVVL